MADQLFSGDERQYLRRFPLYLLLDVSLSMRQNGAIDGLRQGVAMLKEALEEVPEARTVHIKVITFGDRVEPTSLTPLRQFQPPALDATGTETRLGAALAKLDGDARFGADLIENRDQHKGDMLPIVVIITDGFPTDTGGPFESAAAAIKRRAQHQQMNVMAIACGPDTDRAAPALTQITDTVFVQREMTRQRMEELMAWVSQSMAVHTQSMSAQTNANVTQPTQLPEPPPGLVLWR